MQGLGKKSVIGYTCLAFCARCFKYSETSKGSALKKINLKIATTDIFEDFILDAREYPGSVTFLGGEILQIY